MRTTTLQTVLSAGPAMLAFFCTTALAQDSGGLDEIVITATKMGETKLQETPLAVTAFSGDLLNKTGITDVRDLVAVAPNMNIAQNSAFAQIYIRGVGSNNVFVGADPSSTLHVDGVYMARPVANFANFLDVERVEILRGPQGTIYGRNSVGGTINIISRKPGNDFAMKLQATAGNYDLWRGEGYISGPIIEDKLAASISFMRSKRDGYIENIVPGNRDIDSEDMWSLRGQLRLTPNEHLDIVLRADTMEDDGVIAGYVKLLQPWAPFEDAIIDDFHKVALDSSNIMKRENKGISLEISYDLSDAIKIMSLTAYRKSKLDSSADTDATSSLRNVTEFYETQDQFSQELNLSGNLENISYVFGLYYFEEDMTALSFAHNFVTGQRVNPNPHVATKAWAAYGQTEYRFTDHFSATVGVRYTEEEKTFDQNFRVLSMATGNPLLGPIIYTTSDTYKAWTPKFGLDFKPTENIMLYVSATRGFKSGGYNFASANPAQGYGPEFLWSYEAGVKSDLLNRRLRLNASAFYYDYTDLQVQSFLMPGVIDITNAADAEIKGFEIELLARPVDGLEFGGAFSHLDAKYKNFSQAPVPGGVIDASGKNLNSAPKWSYNFFGQYTFTLGDAGELFVRGEYSWKSRQYFTVVNDMIQTQGNYDLINASVGYISPDGRWQAVIFGRNLANEAYITSSGSFTARPAGRVGTPRTYGLTLSFNY